MALTIEQGFSVSLPFTVTDGPLPTVDSTATPIVTSDNPGSVRLVYPDPTPGVANPARSIRVDAISGSGANIHVTADGHPTSTLVTVTPPVNRGATTLGEPSPQFPTPA